MIDFVEARRRLEGKDRSLRDKRVSLADAAALVEDGDVVAVGGCLYSRTPMAVLREVLKRRPSDVTITRNLTSFEAELFIVAGSSRAVITSWMGIGLPWGISPILRRYVESGALRFEEWSHLALGLRFRAAAMGIPFLPTLSMLGSDLMRTSGAQTMDCPYTGETLCLVPALFPDVTIVHVHRADRFGNGQIDGYSHMDADMAAAGGTVIMSAEMIVEPDEIRARRGETDIPFFAVDAVVEAPFGAHPNECFGLYDADMEHISGYAEAVRRDGDQAVKDYIDRHVFGPSSLEEYLDGAGRERLDELCATAAELVV